MPAATRTFPCVLGPSGWLYSCRLRALNRDLASQAHPRFTPVIERRHRGTPRCGKAWAFQFHNNRDAFAAKPATRRCRCTSCQSLPQAARAVRCGLCSYPT